jgi:hypothetical protein
MLGAGQAEVARLVALLKYKCRWRDVRPMISALPDKPQGDCALPPAQALRKCPTGKPEKDDAQSYCRLPTIAKTNLFAPKEMANEAQRISAQRAP